MERDPPALDEVPASPPIPPEVMAELEQAVERVLKGIRDPEVMRKAAERMDRMREAMKETNIAVELIREARDPE
jgi:hypothetical protein